MPLGSLDQKIFPVFVVIWVVLGLFSAAFFFLGKNASLKRKVLLPFIVATDILFVGFIWAMGFPTQVFFIMILAVVVITFLNFRAVKFCDACGKTNINQNPFSSDQFCSKCGAKLG